MSGFTDFFQNRELPGPQPLPEPTGFDLIRDMLMRKMFELQGNPYGMKPGAGNGGFSTGLMPAPAFGNSGGGMGGGMPGWPTSPTSGGGGTRSMPPRPTGMNPMASGAKPGARVPISVGRPHLDAHLRSLVGPRHFDSLFKQTQRKAFGGDPADILRSQGFNWNTGPGGMTNFMRGGQSYTNMGSQHEGGGWGGQSDFLKGQGFKSGRGGRYGGDLSMFDKMMAQIGQQNRRNAAGGLTQADKARMSASGRDIFGNQVAKPRPSTPTISPSTPVGPAGPGGGNTFTPQPANPTQGSGTSIQPQRPTDKFGGSNRLPPLAPGSKPTMPGYKPNPVGSAIG